MREERWGTQVASHVYRGTEVEYRILHVSWTIEPSFVQIVWREQSCWIYREIGRLYGSAEGLCVPC